MILICREKEEGVGVGEEVGVVSPGLKGLRSEKE